MIPNVARRLRVEWEVLFLALFVGVFYFTTLGMVPLVGEETRRALVAREMRQSGDWIVPHQQGLPRLTKPPAQYWAIAFSTWLLGGETRWAIRLSSVLAIGLTALLVYGYSRNFLSRRGALLAGLGFLAMPEILHSGRFAQIDPMFMFLLSGALLTWHWGYLAGWSREATWVVGYAFMALAALTKGPQAPVYFIGGVGLYLVLRRDWSYFFSLGHALGLAVFAALFGAWLVPFWMQMGRHGVSFLLFDESVTRSNLLHPNFWLHFARFPFEVFLGSLPSSLLLLGFASKRFRARLGNAQQPALFLGACFALALPTCWLPPGGETRYLMPLYPCLACLAAVVLDRAEFTTNARPALRLAWQSLRWGSASVWSATAVGVVVWGAGILGLRGPGLTEAMVLALVMIGLIIVFWRTSRLPMAAPGPAFTVVVCLTALTYSWVGLGLMVRHARDMAKEVEQARGCIPPGTPLHSVGWVDHRFAFYYPDPVHVIPASELGRLPADGAYFCFDIAGTVRPTLPFAWETVAEIPMDRYPRSGPPKTSVVIARRLRTGSRVTSTHNATGQMASQAQNSVR